MAQAKAQAICGRLQRGEDCEDAVKEFVALGTSVPDGLLLAALGNRSQKIESSPKSLRLLLEGKGSPHATDQMTQGPIIHSACWHGSPEVVKILVEYRADIEAKEPRMGTPPLNTALAAGNANVCLELLNRNADVQWKHHDGATALHVATAWIASSHNSNLRMPPVGEEPRAVIAMMLHNGVDPTQTEGMSKGNNRSVGMTPLESFRREIARSPWRNDEQIGKKFDKTAKLIHTLLEQGEKAVKLKQGGNKKFSDKKYEDALKEYAEARSIWEKADIRGHHLAVLWNNEATCRRNMKDLDGCRKAAEEGLTHYTTEAIRQKLEFNLAESKKPPPEPTPEEKAKMEEELKLRAEKAKEKEQKRKEELKEITQKSVQSGEIYGDGGSAQKDYVMPGPYICPMDQAYDMGIGPPPPPKPWWEQRDADSDEEAPRTGIGYLPAHHPGNDPQHPLYHHYRGKNP